MDFERNNSNLNLLTIVIQKKDFKKSLGPILQYDSRENKRKDIWFWIRDKKLHVYGLYCMAAGNAGTHRL